MCDKETGAYILSSRRDNLAITLFHAWNTIESSLSSVLDHTQSCFCAVEIKPRLL